MAFINGDHNEWQTGDINGRAHAIEKCGSHTGHTVRPIAFCDSPETAALIIHAFALLHRMVTKTSAYDAEPVLYSDAKEILQRAGLLK